MVVPGSAPAAPAALGAVTACTAASPSRTQSMAKPSWRKPLRTLSPIMSSSSTSSTRMTNQNKPGEAHCRTVARAARALCETARKLTSASESARFDQLVQRTDVQAAPTRRVVPALRCAVTVTLVAVVARDHVIAQQRRVGRNGAVQARRRKAQVAVGRQQPRPEADEDRRGQTRAANLLQLPVVVD
ncbi:putative histone-lysine N-methyltransferase, H3 lysine-9 specific SUVH9-like protein, partial [Corchorus olitorius]